MRPSRRVVLATDVAETGLTIPTLGYVIDSGWMKKPEYIFGWGAAGMFTRPAPQSGIIQRRGRSGRLFPGTFAPLYTEAAFDALSAAAPPAIVTERLGGYILDVVGAGAAVAAGGAAGTAGGAAGGAGRAGTTDVASTTFRPEHMDMLTPPPPMALWAGLSAGIVAGVLDAAGNMTKAGQLVYIDEPGLDLEAWHAAQAAALHRVSLLDLATAQAALDLDRPLFGQPFPSEQEIALGLAKRPGGAPATPETVLAGHEAGRIFAGKDVRKVLRSDAAEAVWAIDAFAEAAHLANGRLQHLQEWCAARGISHDAAVALAARREALLDTLTGLGINIYAGDRYRITEAGAGEDVLRDRLRRFRRALAEIWRERLLVWDRKHQSYRLAGTAVSGGRAAATTPLVLVRGGLEPRLWGGEPPRYAVAGRLVLKPRVDPSTRERLHQYELSATDVSAVDGTPDDVLYAHPEQKVTKTKGDPAQVAPRASYEAFRVLVDAIGEIRA